MSMLVNISPAIQPITEQVIPTFAANVVNGGREAYINNRYSEYCAQLTQEKTALINKANNVDATNPSELIEIQEMVGNYSLTMNMVSTLTHKCTSAVDSVLKAQ